MRARPAARGRDAAWRWRRPWSCRSVSRPTDRGSKPRGYWFRNPTARASIPRAPRAPCDFTSDHALRIHSVSSLSPHPTCHRARPLSLPRRVSAPGFSCFLFAAACPRSEGGRSAGRRIALTCRARKARRHACEAWAVPRNRDAASRRSTVALSAQGPLPSPASPDPARRLIAARRACLAAVPGRLVSAGYAPRPTPHPAPPSGSSPEDAPR